MQVYSIGVTFYSHLTKRAIFLTHLLWQHSLSATVQVEEESVKYSEEGPLVYPEDSESFPRVREQTGEPGGLPSMGSHRVGHNWSDLAVADMKDKEEFSR